LYIEVKEDQGYDLAFSTFSSLEEDERDWQGSVFLVFFESIKNIMASKTNMFSFIHIHNLIE